MAYYNEIELWKDIKPEEWNDWRWQVENRIDSVEKLKKIINVTKKEEEDISKVLEKFRMGKMCIRDRPKTNASTSCSINSVRYFSAVSSAT